MSGADTTTPHGRLILTVLGGLAEFERHLIVARTSEGRKRARAHGVLFGRPRKLTPYQRREAIARRDAGEETLADIARSYNVLNDQPPMIDRGASKVGRGLCRGGPGAPPSHMRGEFFEASFETLAASSAKPSCSSRARMHNRNKRK
jgi:hypothetical protein